MDTFQIRVVRHSAREGPSTNSISDGASRV